MKNNSNKEIASLLEAQKVISTLCNLFENEDVTKGSIENFQKVANGGLEAIQNLVTEDTSMTKQETINYIKNMIIVDKGNLWYFLVTTDIYSSDKVFHTSLYDVIIGDKIEFKTDYDGIVTFSTVNNNDEVLIVKNSENYDSKVVHEKKDINEALVKLLENTLSNEKTYVVK